MSSGGSRVQWGAGGVEGVAFLRVEYGKRNCEVSSPPFRAPENSIGFFRAKKVWDTRELPLSKTNWQHCVGLQDNSQEEMKPSPLVSFFNRRILCPRPKLQEVYPHIPDPILWNFCWKLHFLKRTEENIGVGGPGDSWLWPWPRCIRHRIKRTGEPITVTVGCVSASVALGLWSGVVAEWRALQFIAFPPLLSSEAPFVYRTRQIRLIRNCIYSPTDKLPAYLTSLNEAW